MRHGTRLSGARDVLSEAEEVGVGVGENELVHLPLAWRERGENGGSGSTKLGLKRGGGARGEIEVDAIAGVVAFQHVGLVEVDLRSVAAEEGVTVAVLVSPGGEAEQTIEGDGAGELLNYEHRDCTKDGISCHRGTWRVSVSNWEFGVKPCERFLGIDELST